MADRVGRAERSTRHITGHEHHASAIHSNKSRAYSAQSGGGPRILASTRERGQDAAAPVAAHGHHMPDRGAGRAAEAPGRSFTCCSSPVTESASRDRTRRLQPTLRHARDTKSQRSRRSGALANGAASRPVRIRVIARSNNGSALAAWHGPKLRELRKPVLVLHGDKDPILRVSAARATARAIDGARLIILPGVGHDLPAPLRPRIADEVRRVADQARAAARTPA